MTATEARIAGILIRVVRRQVTVDQLKQQLADGQEQVETVGRSNATPCFLERLAVIESAIIRIESRKAQAIARSN